MEKEKKDLSCKDQLVGEKNELKKSNSCLFIVLSIIIVFICFSIAGSIYVFGLDNAINLRPVANFFGFFGFIALLVFLWFVVNFLVKDN